MINHTQRIIDKRNQTRARQRSALYLETMQVTRPINLPLDYFIRQEPRPTYERYVPPMMMVVCFIIPLLLTFSL